MKAKRRRGSKASSTSDHIMEMEVSYMLWLFYPWRTRAPDNQFDRLSLNMAARRKIPLLTVTSGVKSLYWDMPGSFQIRKCLEFLGWHGSLSCQFVKEKKRTEDLGNGNLYHRQLNPQELLSFPTANRNTACPVMIETEGASDNDPCTTVTAKL
jgi:hypothetical protein